MKKILLLLTLSILFACCNKDDNPIPTPTPVSQLPPATQTGANTFGCLLDGEVFKPSNLPNSTNCYYQLLNNEYFFYVSAQKTMSNNIVTIALKTQKKQITQNETYNLFEDINGNASGNYLYNLEFNSTSTLNNGQLKITKLDFTNNIVSGTFFYDVKDSQNIVHQIREGRFDMRFTQ